MNVLFVSLGCDKNLVDSEYMLGILREKGYEGDIIVIGKISNKATQNRVKEVGGIGKYPSDAKTQNRPVTPYYNKQSETNGEYGQMTIFDLDGGAT